MQVSVVVCTYAESMYPEFREAAESVLAQSYADVELVVVVDGTDAVYERVQSDLGHRDRVVTHCNEENRGLAASRNVGAELASGDVVAFMDDDAVADEDWVERLVDAYEEHDPVAVGGKMVPNWVAGRPRWLPEEFFWLVGVTHRGFADGEGEVRNTNGSNISFRRDVFLDLGGFDPAMGLQGERQLQAEEPEFCSRLYRETGEGVWYTPDATVAHKVLSHRLQTDWLLQRAFWQGYSKRAMEDLVPDSGGTERDFLGQLLGEFLPGRLLGLVRSPSVERAEQLVMFVVFTATVGIGYGYGMVTWDEDDVE
jgi:glycosyltransferase involved in cell wall biosynthesis